MLDVSKKTYQGKISPFEFQAALRMGWRTRLANPRKLDHITQRLQGLTDRHTLWLTMVSGGSGQLLECY